MDPFDYAQLGRAGLPLRLPRPGPSGPRAREREYVPDGMEGLLADDSLDDYVWLWIKDSGPNGFRQYLRDGGYPEAEVAQAFLWARTEWGMDTPPHVAWLKKTATNRRSSISG